MKIVFMGTPEFAVPSLQALIDNHEVVAICTQPDRPAGRGNKLKSSPVKVLAMEHNIPVLQPSTLRLSESREIRTQLKSYGADIFVVAAYGLLLPKGVLDMPPLGCINVHGSLLPKYRGASPIHAALLNGDITTGITIMYMDVTLDTGDMLLQKPLEIAFNERFTAIHDRMAILGGQALIEALEEIKNGTSKRVLQDDALSCYAPIIKKTDGHVDWSKTTQQIQNQIRAYDPWPSSYTMYGEQMLKIWDIEGQDADPSITPGTVIIANSSQGLLVKTGDGAAWISEIQSIGGKRMPDTDYLRGREIIEDSILS